MATLLLLHKLRPRFLFLVLLLLLLLLTVFTRHSSCSRHLRQPAAAGPPLDNGGVPAEQTKKKIALKTETETAVSRREELAAKYYGELLLNRKPRGRPPPSAPSKRTNDVNN